MIETRTEQALSAVETSELSYLDPQKLRFFRHGATLRLTIEGDRSYPRVSVLRAFPLSEPDRWSFGHRSLSGSSTVPCPRPAPPGRSPPARCRSCCPSTGYSSP